jgi:hypothetical protein
MENPVEQTIEKINNSLSKMDLPINRRDASRPETVKWLLQNLAARNKAHARYSETMRSLLDRASALNLLKTKEVKQLEADLQ